VLLQSVSLDVTVMYNDSMSHSVPVAVNVITNAVLAMLNPKHHFHIDITSKPWPDIPVNLTLLLQTLALVYLGIGLTIIAPSFAVTVVQDRQVRPFYNVSNNNIEYTGHGSKNGLLYVLFNLLWRVIVDEYDVSTHQLRALFMY